MATQAQAVPFDWDAPEIAALIRAALEEDVGPGDMTTGAVVLAEAQAQAQIVAKQDLVLAGWPLAERVFRALDGKLCCEAAFAEGAAVPTGAVVARLRGSAGALLTAERTALNFLARLCGIATHTRRFVEAIAGTSAQIRDTRKTTPLLRRLEKYAVRVGGGSNHRFGLYDAVLIKENHIALAGNITEALRRARAGLRAASAEATSGEMFALSRPGLQVQVEVRNEAELREALAAGADAVLLDNVFPMEAARLIALVRRERSGCRVEVSGGVKLSNVRAYAEAGADFISVGALTHSAPAADLSLLIER